LGGENPNQGTKESDQEAPPKEVGKPGKRVKGANGVTEKNLNREVITVKKSSLSRLKAARGRGLAGGSVENPKLKVQRRRYTPSNGTRKDSSELGGGFSSGKVHQGYEFIWKGTHGGGIKNKILVGEAQRKEIIKQKNVDRERNSV